VVKGIAELPSDTVIDGEIVALDASGKPSFNLLQGFGVEPQQSYAFDLLMWRGNDVRFSSLEERREQLRQILSHFPEAIRFSDTFDVPLSETHCRSKTASA
jgi:ATP-dependent DNA ligase